MRSPIAHPEMVAAGRADPQVALKLLVEDLRLARLGHFVQASGVASRRRERKLDAAWLDFRRPPQAIRPGVGDSPASARAVTADADRGGRDWRRRSGSAAGWRSSRRVASPSAPTATASRPFRASRRAERDSKRDAGGERAASPRARGQRHPAAARCCGRRVAGLPLSSHRGHRRGVLPAPRGHWMPLGPDDARPAQDKASPAQPQGDLILTNTAGAALHVPISLRGATQPRQVAQRAVEEDPDRARRAIHDVGHLRAS